MGRAIISGLVVLISGCISSTPAEYERASDEPVNLYFEERPERPYSELTSISVEYRELGVFRGRGNDQVVLEMLRDRAIEVDADAVISVTVTTERIQDERNRRWIGRGIAISYD